jgi:hypothetical protein
MMRKLNRRGDERATAAGVRVKEWTGLGTVMLATVAWSLAPSVSHAGILDKAAKPGSAASPSFPAGPFGG